MCNRIDITFSASRSAKYARAVELAGRLPGPGPACHIEGELEILMHYQDVEELAGIVLGWRSGSVLVNGKPCRSLTQFRSINRKGAADSQRIGNHTWDYEEGLPLPFVHYPRSHGTFIGFSTRPDGLICLCSCAKKAVENYLALNRGKDPAKDFPLGLDPAAIIYQPGICHKCRKLVPRLMWCSPMYSSKSERSYGWYEKQAFYAMAIHPQMLGETEEHRAAVKTKAKEQAKHSLGIRTGSKGEEELYHIISELCPDEDIIRNYHPSWLEGMELDIFLPGRKLAFEYQGAQHYMKVEHWGGEKGLEERREHDKKKERLCEENGILLVTIRYDMNLDKKTIAALLADRSG